MRRLIKLSLVLHSIIDKARTTPDVAAQFRRQAVCKQKHYTAICSAVVYQKQTKYKNSFTMRIHVLTYLEPEKSFRWTREDRLIDLMVSKRPMRVLSEPFVQETQMSGWPFRRRVHPDPDLLLKFIQKKKNPLTPGCGSSLWSFFPSVLRWPAGSPLPALSLPHSPLFGKCCSPGADPRLIRIRFQISG